MTQLSSSSPSSASSASSASSSTSARTAAEDVDNRPSVAAAVDIYETKSDVWLVADLCGVDKDHLVVEAKDGEIALRGETSALGTAPLTYARAFRLPPGVDVDGITADLKDGVLTVKLPKHSAHKPRVIGIN